MNLSFGEINVTGAADVIRALANKPELKKVDLNGRSCLYQLLSLCVPVSHLGNLFGEEGVEQVREMMEANGHLEILGSLSDDEGDEEEEQEKEEEEEEEEENQTVIPSSDTQTNTNSSLPQTVRVEH